MGNLESYGVSNMLSQELYAVNGGGQGYEGGYFIGRIAGTLTVVAIATIKMAVQLL